MNVKADTSTTTGPPTPPMPTATRRQQPHRRDVELPRHPHHRPAARNLTDTHTEPCPIRGTTGHPGREPLAISRHGAAFSRSSFERLQGASSGGRPPSGCGSTDTAILRPPAAGQPPTSPAPNTAAPVPTEPSRRAGRRDGTPAKVRCLSRPRLPMLQITAVSNSGSYQPSTNPGSLSPLSSTSRPVITPTHPTTAMNTSSEV